MGHDLRLWEDVAASCRAGDLHEAVRLVRQHVDGNPHDLAPRFLLASLYITMEQPGLALLQYERLLPLAVGRGQLFLALAAQRRLDLLHPQVTLHARRYHAMHQWFVSLARSERKRRGAEASRRFGPHVLVGLSAQEFALAAERCAVEALGMERRALQPEHGLLWVVLHGRLRWGVEREGADPAPAQIAEAGDIVVLPAEAEGVTLWIEPETPAECLRLEPELFAHLEPEAIVPPPADPALEEQVADLVSAAGGVDVPADLQAAPAPPLGDPALVAEVERLADESAEIETVVAPPRPAPRRRPRVGGPRPDPVAEPMLAVGAPIERRRETRLSVSLANKVALLGIAGNRVAALPGALVDLSPGGVSVRFRRGDLLQSRAVLLGAVIHLQLSLPGEHGALRLAARVAWVGGDEHGGDAESEMRMGLEFLAVRPDVQARLERLVMASAG